MRLNCVKDIGKSFLYQKVIRLRKINVKMILNSLKMLTFANR